MVSIEAVPVALVPKLPAGFGRKDPNVNPVLPKPTGRLKFVNAILFWGANDLPHVWKHLCGFFLQTLNPFSLGAQFCGEALFMKIFCCLLCVGIVVACVVGAPFINIIFSL